MTQLLTNAQVALQCAVDSFGQVRLLPDASAVTTYADRYLRWLDTNTPPPVDQSGELG